MNDMFAVVAVTVAGLLLGALFFAGLWWTTGKGLTSNQPALWFVGSLLLRMMMMLSALYYLSNGDWRRLTGCLIGFTIARITLLRILPSASLHGGGT